MPHPLDVIIESFLTKISLHNISCINADRRVEAGGNILKGHTQELPILSKKAAAVDDPAPNDITCTKRRPVALITTTVSYTLTQPREHL